MNESRDNKRKRVIAQIEIIAPDGWLSITCSMFNISETGAMVSVPRDYQFPPSFIFQWKGKVESVPAQLVWFRDGLAGIRFLAEDSLLPNSRCRGLKP